MSLELEPTLPEDVMGGRFFLGAIPIEESGVLLKGNIPVTNEYLASLSPKQRLDLITGISHGIGLNWAFIPKGEELPPISE